MTAADGWLNRIGQVAPMCPFMWAHAQPGKYDWTYASFGPLESTSQTANQSVQPFLHTSWQSVIGHIGAAWRILSNLCFLRPSNPQLKWKIVRSFVFAQLMADTLPWAPISPKLPFPMGDLDPHLTHDCNAWAHPSPQPNRHLDCFSRFCTDDAECSYIL